MGYWQTKIKEYNEKYKCVDWEEYTYKIIKESHGMLKSGIYFVFRKSLMNSLLKEEISIKQGRITPVKMFYISKNQLKM